MYCCKRYSLEEINTSRNLHIISMEPINKKNDETYHILIYKYYLLGPGSRDGILNIDDQNECIGMKPDDFKQLVNTLRDVRIQHSGKILSTTRLEPDAIQIYKKDLNGKITEFFDEKSEWIVCGYIY